MGIAHDVDPIELVLWLPQLCRNKNIPFVIVKNKARLGKIVHQSTASCVALTAVKKEDNTDLENVCKIARNEFLESSALMHSYGSPVMGIKATHHKEKLEKLKQQEIMR